MRFVVPFVVLLAGCSTAPPAPPMRDASAGGTDASNPQVDAGPRARGDAEARLPPAELTVTLPYGAPPQLVPLEATADLGALDVVFSIDTTGSFGGEIDALQADLDTRVVPQIQRRVQDVAFGVARFEDFPESPFGVSTDRPFRLLTPVTSDLAQVRAAVALLDQPLGNGGDVPESGAEALYQLATGDGLLDGNSRLVPRYEAAQGTYGGAGFRDGAYAVIVHVTDAPTHEPADYAPRFPGAHGSDQALRELIARRIQVVGIASSSAARPSLERFAVQTGAQIAPTNGLCPTGQGGIARPPLGGACPLVFDLASDGTGLSTTLVDAVVRLLEGIGFDEVYGRALDDRLGFVEAIEATGATVPTGGAPPERADRRPSADGIEDTYLDVSAGTTVRFRARFRNDSIRQSDYDQVFRVTIELQGDGRVVARRVVRVVVPAMRITARDAGPADAFASDARDASEHDASQSDLGGDGD